MEWTFHDEAPIYLQIMEQLKRQIAIGELKPGDKIPAVRELAIEAGVNPNTMQKALSELEREGLLYSQRTSGRFVSDNREDARNLQQELVVQYMQAYMMNMKKMGYSPKQSAESYMEYVSNFSDNS